MAQAHAEGDYERALDLAGHAQEQMAEYFGADHPVVGSAWNNVAILRKRLGRWVWGGKAGPNGGCECEAWVSDALHRA